MSGLRAPGATRPLALLGLRPLVPLLAFLVAAAACGDDAPSPGTADSGTRGAGSEAEATIDREAPAYSARTLAGDTVSLAGLRGAPVLLNVWATWCAPCRQEIPELQALYEEHTADGLRVVGVTVDSRSAIDNVREFLDDFGVTYDIWIDPDQTALSAFGGMGVPLTVLVDSDGRIRWEHLGALERNDPGLREALNNLL